MGYRILRQRELWESLLVIYFIDIGILPLGRAILEGFPYDVSLSSVYGNFCLIVAILIGATVIKRQTEPFGWINTAKFDLIFVPSALVTGVLSELTVLANSNWKPGQVTDMFHNLVIIPFFAYMLATTLPVIRYKGTKKEQIVALGCLLVWAVLFIIDFLTGRLFQRAWMSLHGVTM